MPRTSVYQEVLYVVDLETHVPAVFDSKSLLCNGQVETLVVCVYHTTKTMKCRQKYDKEEKRHMMCLFFIYSN